jgi:hypothetical protein
VKRILVAFALMALGASAQAQSTVVEIPHTEDAVAVAAAATRIATVFRTSVAYSEADDTVYEKAQVGARRTLYTMIENECASLAEIFKRDCRVVSVSIDNPRASKTRTPNLGVMSASAVYELKPKPAAQPMAKAEAKPEARAHRKPHSRSRIALRSIRAALAQPIRADSDVAGSYFMAAGRPRGVGTDQSFGHEGLSASSSRSANFLSGDHRGVRDDDRSRLARSNERNGVCDALRSEEGVPARFQDSGRRGARSSRVLDTRGATGGFQCSDCGQDRRRSFISLVDRHRRVCRDDRFGLRFAPFGLRARAHGQPAMSQGHACVSDCFSNDIPSSRRVRISRNSRTEH